MANVRLQVDFSERRVAQLERLMEICDIATKKELLNNALSLFEWAVREAMQGRAIASVNEAEEKYQTIVVPALHAASLRREEPA